MDIKEMKTRVMERNYRHCKRIGEFSNAQSPFDFGCHFDSPMFRFLLETDEFFKELITNIEESAFEEHLFWTSRNTDARIIRDEGRRSAYNYRMVLTYWYGDLMGNEASHCETKASRAAEQALLEMGTKAARKAFLDGTLRYIPEHNKK